MIYFSFITLDSQNYYKFKLSSYEFYIGTKNNLLIDVEYETIYI
ncbi:hypothetical protein NIES4071_00830 [Calothrix sp. NIES-4071]|nr:hypothetical protein NIES4071_00830 [Calothrix sp. NIES-4071]BAZ54429.1 hypothetical protein NIES4105_00820 [Calothrix sp. NIES-4105]